MITNLQATCVSIVLLQSCLPHNTSAFVNKEPPSDEYPSDFFPPIIDADDISYFFPDDLQGLHWALTNIFSRSRRNPSSSIAPPLPDILVSRGGGDTYTSEYKLMHDIQQVEYLVDVLNDTDTTTVEYLQREVLPIYQRVLRNIPPLEELTLTKGLYAFSQDDYDAGISTVYNKALYGVTSDELYPSWREESLLNSRLDWEEVEHQWFGESNSSSEYEDDASSVVVIDELLNDHTLDILRKLLLRNTHWYQTKTPLQFGKYVGAYIDDGLNDPIFLELAKALHDSLPRIMKGHDLRYLWAYKYDSEWSNGINLHADQAAVNVNIWLSLDGANLDQDSGGLVVYTTKPPDSWGFESYNTHTERVVEQLLKPTNFANVTIPHRPNRAVIFDSALFHQSDKYHFQRGYENGRINLTLLFGTMHPVLRDEL